MEQQSTFRQVRSGETFRMPGSAKFLVKIAGGYKNLEGGALHSCAADQVVTVAQKVSG